ncbi:MAG: hypothetical protein ACOVP4_10485 [Bacteriovoracaceae bacterium]
MFNVITSYVNIVIGLLFCFVLSRFEQRKRNTKIAGTILFYYLMVCIFKNLPNHANLFAAYLGIHFTIAGLLILLLLGVGLFGAKKVFAHFFERDMEVKK